MRTNILIGHASVYVQYYSCSDLQSHAVEAEPIVQWLVEHASIHFHRTSHEHRLPCTCSSLVATNTVCNPLNSESLLIDEILRVYYPSSSHSSIYRTELDNALCGVGSRLFGGTLDLL